MSASQSPLRLCELGNRFTESVNGENKQNQVHERKVNQRIAYYDPGQSRPLTVRDEDL